MKNEKMTDEQKIVIPENRKSASYWADALGEPRIVSPEEWLAEGVVGKKVGVDFETLYTAAYSVKKLGTHGYCKDEKFDAYLVAVADSEKVCVCRPEDFPWESIAGLFWCSHNREFDQSIFERLVELGILPPGTAGPKAWWCTAAVCAFLQFPRDLAGAVAAVFGIKLDKGTRNRAQGRSGDDVLDDEMLLYAARDAVGCLALWDRLQGHWPTWERELFEATCAMGRDGVAVDWGHVAECRKQLVLIVADLKSSLPWKPALSTKKFGTWCEDSGVPEPPCTKAKDPGFLAWKEKYADTAPGGWVETMQRIRSTNRLEKVLGAMEARRNCADNRYGIRNKGNNATVECRSGDKDRMIYEVKYCGANTGRWAGGGGLNLQNLNRSSVQGVDVRKSIVAQAGHKLGVVDYAQIESRVLHWLAGDHESLKLLLENPALDLYEAHARKTMGYAENELLKLYCARTGSGLRQVAKARVLGLGFGCGPDKFVSVAKSMAGLELPLEESRRIVREYRSSNPIVISLWNRLEAACRGKVGGDYILPLPGTQWDRSFGRFLIYRNVHLRGRDIRCVVRGKECTVYGGVLAQNFTQATARDILALAWLRCVEAGYTPVLSVHDELVFELPEESAESDLAQIVAIMEEPLPWARGLPLQAEGSLMDFYQK
ncbi:DNA polymerase [Kiritimatiellaeota bacterium B1221]|nr:DNA polymerase [Kiritimatiellaeota bacterium B1221]